MATLPVTLTDVGALVAEKNKLYQPEGPRIPGDPRYQDKPSNATPTNLKMLLDQLDAYTKAVQEAAEKEGMTNDSVVQQWQNDMANWQFRLAHYYQALAMAPAAERDTLAGADAVYFTVTSPLLDGVWYEIAPGINYSPPEKERMAKGGLEGFSERKANDLYFPFMLGNQVVVYREHQSEMWDKLWEDLAANAKRLGAPPGQDPLGAVFHVLVTVVSGLIGGGVTYLGIQGYELNKRRNMARAMQRVPPTR